MDYRHPVRTVIPGVQGRVLEALARVTEPLTIRRLAELAGVSHTAAGDVIGPLVRAGVVQRREVGRSSLVSLDRENVGARAVLELADARGAVIRDLRVSAALIRPAPASLVIFGSFGRGTAGANSDLDVVAVRADDVEADEDVWLATLGAWLDQAARLSGLSVNHFDLSQESLLSLAPALLHEMERDGVLLTGQPIGSLRGQSRV